jgi:hypothetical protein
VATRALASKTTLFSLIMKLENETMDFPNEDDEGL